MQAHLRLSSGLVRVRIEGPDHGPALVLSHSLAAHLEMWDGQIAHWARRFRVVRYDLRGHGGSAGPSGPYALDELGRDGLDLLDALGLAQVHWCGLSLGGMVGLWLLANAPGRIDHAVVAHSAAHLGPPEIWNGRIRTVARHGMERIVEPTLRLWLSDRFRHERPEQVEALAQMIRATSDMGFQGCCAAIRDMDLRPSLARISRPVLVIAGRHDRATTPDDSALIAGGINRARLVTLDTAHFGNVEQPQAFAETVDGFLT